MRINQKIKYNLLIFNMNTQIIPNSFEPVKTKLFIIIAVGMVSNAVFGQISLRPYAGVSISKFRFDETFDEGVKNKFKPGLNLGVGIDFPINDALSIETGIGFIQKGSSISEEYVEFGINGKYNADYQIGYIGLPLLVKLQKEIGDLKFSFFGGPSINFRVNYKEKYKIEYEEGLSYFVEEGESNYTEELKIMDINLNIGGLVEYENFTLGLTYLHGLTDISQGENVKNTSFLINLGYRFEL